MDLANQVREGLTASRKRLPPVLFYDETGSRLFDKITETPEYYLTPAESSILVTHGVEIIRSANGHGPLSVVELGAGSATKTRVLLRELLKAQRAVTYVPIDVSAAPVLAAAVTLPRELAGLTVSPIIGDNAEALARLSPQGPARLFLFLGSSIGNFELDEAERFLAAIGARMRRQDRLLLGTDLAKDKATLEAAYNDAAGVTAQFNLNVLRRLNREFGADFDLGAFRHVARYDETKRRIEMHLAAQSAQQVSIPKLALEVAFEPGETIHTENSYKYRAEDIHALAAASGLVLDRTWTDRKAHFALHLLREGDA